MPVSSIPLILKPEHWPTVDRRAWQHCLVHGGLFDTGGAFTSWSEGTRRVHAQGYGSWLSFIRRHHSELMDKSPANRVTPETVQAYIDDGRERLKPRSITNQILSLAVVMRGFAPDEDLAWLWKVVKRLERISESQELKPPIPLAAGEVFQWSLRRLHELRSIDLAHHARIPAEFRQALMVGLLMARPVRVRAIVAMTVSKHVEIAGERISLNFEAKDMKNRKACRFLMPKSLVPFMLDYLSVYRPLLLHGSDSDALWISERGNPLSQDSFTSGLALLTKQAFGITLRPHAFRHIAATTIAMVDPAHAGIIRDILGHATTRMGEKHYNRATSLEASERHQEVLRNLRRNHRKRKAAGRRRRTAGRASQEE
ncbi:tyrosine-type recombinase/integrase [Labrys sp. ZIDIC5]|uniref:tyrosine-type recombinase/integrase n=1 Tax=Labrys sedimenti TaxID=3106036 RepID=UPI002ACAE333|nr:tyrosine-type recombinase/integrase [Labrys sp. ZIDIC5]MDZ5454445.1 tyrosine-type recombinase/integrase [Labrys sp. ZIDIC5]